MFEQLCVCGQCWFVGCVLFFQLCQYGGFFSLFLVGGVDVFEVFQLVQVVFGYVVYVGGGGGVFYFDVGVGFVGVGDYFQYGVVVFGDGWVGEVGGFVEFIGQCVVVGVVWVVGYYYEVVGVQWLVGEFQEMFGLVWYVVGGEGGWFVVFVDVGVVE